MMELDKYVHSDWFEIREKYDNVFSLDEYMDLTVPQLEEIIQSIRLSVEEGVLEYKRMIISRILSFIESLKFDTKQFAEIGDYALLSTKLLYVILLQRLFSTGQIVPGRQEKEKDPEEMEEQYKEKDIKTIMSELSSMVKEDAALIQKQEVKNILLQFKIYQKELEEMNKLKNNIPKEKLPSFLNNFKNTIDGITKKVQDNYSRILKEKSAPAAPVFGRGDLRAHSLSGLTTVFQKQAELGSKIRSRFLFARNERYNTREIFEAATALLSELKDTIKIEESRYRTMAPSESSEILLAKSFSVELVRRIEKNIATRT